MAIKASRRARRWACSGAALLIVLAASANVGATSLLLERALASQNLGGAGSLGLEIAIDGARLLATDGSRASPAVRLFDLRNGEVLQTFAANGILAIDGNRVMIGLDMYDTTTGSLLRTFSDPDVRGGDRFGQSVAIDQGRVLIGDPGAPFLDILATEVRDMYLGNAYLFDASTGELLHIYEDPTPPNPATLVQSSGDWFSSQVHIDNDTVLIASPLDSSIRYVVAGQAHLFSASTGELISNLNPQLLPGIEVTRFFSYSSSLSSGKALLASLNEATRDEVTTEFRAASGSAYLYSTDGGEFLAGYSIPTGSGPPINEIEAVAVGAGLVAIGEPSNRFSPDDIGKVHIFNESSGSLIQTLTAPDSFVGDLFGRRVLIDNGRVVISGLAEDPDGVRRGRVYVYAIIPEPSAFTSVALSTICFVLIRSTQLSRRR